MMTTSKHNIIFLVILFITNIISVIFAGSNNIIPRFVSTKANEVNVRAGPGIKYPLKWVFNQKGEPVEVINESDQWRHIRDIDNEYGWIHSSVLSGKRTVVILSDKIEYLYRSPSHESKVIAHLEPNVRCEFKKKCTATMCKLNCKSYIGWVNRKAIWGIYDYE